MKTLVVKKEDVKYKLTYQILGALTILFSWSFGIMIWDDVFFDRHRWLTRKNLLKYLQSPHKIEYYKYTFNNDINLKLEDGSEICLWINKKEIFGEWSFHSKDEGGSKTVLTKGMSLSTQVLDRKIQEVLAGIRIKIEEIERTK